MEDTTEMKKKTETTETTKKAEYDMEAHVRDSLYCRNQRKSAAFLILLGVILLASAVLSLWAGSYETPVGELLKGIFGQASDEKINIVVRNVRLPRICTAAAAGAGLGVTGCILQAILNNPLASASTLGVSQGAGFGAAFAIIILGAGTSGSGLGVSFCAFVGSMAVAVVIFALSKFRQVSAESIVLAGVAISSMFTGEVQKFLLSAAYVLPAILYYRKHRTKRGALIGIVLGGIACVITAIITNIYLIFPAYIHLYGMNWDAIIEMCTKVNPLIHNIPTFVLFSVVPFNTISCTVTGLITMLVYKKISAPLKKLIQD